MTVRAILDTKGHHITGVEPDAKLSAAIKILAEKKIGAVLAMSNGRIEGILSERDIVRTMANGGSAVLQLPVGQVMTSNVSTCDVNDSISSVMDRMTTGKFRHMPVLDNDRLAGLVSIGDVLKLNLEIIREHIHRLSASFAEAKLMRL